MCNILLSQHYEGPSKIVFFSPDTYEPLCCSINTLVTVQYSPAISYRQKTSGQMADSKLLLTNFRKEMQSVSRTENLHENIFHANYYF